MSIEIKLGSKQREEKKNGQSCSILLRIYMLMSQYIYIYIQLLYVTD